MHNGFPLGGSCQRPRPLTDEGETLPLLPVNGSLWQTLPLIRPSGATFPTGKGFKETGSLIFFPHRFTLSPNYCKMLYKENGLLCLHGTADRQNNYRWCFLWQFSINVFF